MELFLIMLCPYYDIMSCDWIHDWKMFVIRKCTNLIRQTNKSCTWGARWFSNLIEVKFYDAQKARVVLNCSSCAFRAGFHDVHVFRLFPACLQCDFLKCYVRKRVYVSFARSYHALNRLIHVNIRFVKYEKSIRKFNKVWNKKLQQYLLVANVELWSWE